MEGENAEVRGWGSNESGVLGQGVPLFQTSPVKIMEGIKTISAGGRHAIAILLNGSCLLWGRNLSGQLGNGTLSKKPTTFAAELLSANFPGAHILADLRPIAKQLEAQQQVIKEVPAKAANDELSRGITHIGGAYHEDGRVLRERRTFNTVYNKDGSIRLLHKRAQRKAPALKDRAPPDSQVDWRMNSDLAVYAKPLSGSGGVVDGVEVDSLEPTMILEGVVEVAAGGGHSLATVAGGKCVAFGSNSAGQLGDGSKEKKWTPVCVLEQVRSISTGWYHTLAVTTSNDCYAWGHNDHGQLGIPDMPLECLFPVRILAGVRSVAAGIDHSLALMENGIVVSWGCNSNGQLGNRTMTDVYAPVRVFEDAKAVSAGRCHSHAVHRNGTCFSWGRNTHGQLGDGSTQRRLGPVLVHGLKDVYQISSGVDHTLAVVESGLCYAWGYNGNGRLGDGTERLRDAPIAVLQNARLVAAGQYHSLGVLVNGDCYAWGYNSNGQLGDGTRERHLRPVKILQNVSAVAAGGAHSLAVLRNGGCLAWGWNNAGQVGSPRPMSPVNPAFREYGRDKTDIEFLPIPAPRSPDGSGSVDDLG
jgi:alpha-tubulin suppressor-like RCC1 family protein